MAKTSSEVVEPLEPAIWFERFRVLKERATALDGGSPEPLLRHLFHLCVLTPGPLRHLLRTDVGEKTFETILECGAYDAAALSLAGAEMEYTIQRRTIRGEVDVALALGGIHRSTATAECLAKAFVIAYCECMNSLHCAARSMPMLRNPPRRASQSEPRPKSSMH